jgi:hypothetical protein
MFYEALLQTVKNPIFRHGEWTLCEITGWPDNHSADNLVAWRWVMGDDRRLIVMNLSNGYAEGRVHARWGDLGVSQCRLVDAFPGTSYVRDVGEMESLGLYVALGPWGRHFFEVHPRVQEDLLVPGKSST